MSESSEYYSQVQFVESDEELVRHLTGEGVKVVRFFQINCEHCSKTQNIFEKLSNDYPEILFLDVDVGALNLSTLFKSRVFSLPTVEVWKDGVLVGKEASVDAEKLTRLVSKATQETSSDDDDGSLSRSITQSMSASTQFITSLGSQIIASARGLLSKSTSFNLDEGVEHVHEQESNSRPSRPPTAPGSPSFFSSAASTIQKVWNGVKASPVLTGNVDDWEEVDRDEVSIAPPPPVGKKKNRK